jgi:low affinity Fe/Cu permease
VSSNVSVVKKHRDDVKPDHLGSLDWTPEHARQSLDRVYHHAVKAAQDAIDWYLGGRHSKKRWAQKLRVGAIIMVAVAGILPVLAQIFDTGSSVVIQPAWASVALGIAVALVALDRFFGFSSAWARYITTEQAISAHLNQFMLDWQQANYELTANEVSREKIDHFLGLAKDLAKKTDDHMQAETKQWVKEFKEILTQIEQSSEQRGRRS